jgi:hypothetical protein
MNEQLTRQAQEMFSAAKHARIPESVQALTEESVVKSREAYTKMSAVAKDGVKALEEVMVAAHAGTKAIGEKVFDHAVANAETAFDVAQAMARAKTIPEAFGIQAKFMQQQLAFGSEQAKELLVLSTRVAYQTFDSLNTAVTKTFEELRKAN